MQEPTGAELQMPSWRVTTTTDRRKSRSPTGIGGYNRQATRHYMSKFLIGPLCTGLVLWCALSSRVRLGAKNPVRCSMRNQ